MKMHIHGQLRKYFDLMASIVRRVLDKHEFSEKIFEVFSKIRMENLIRF